MAKEIKAPYENEHAARIMSPDLFREGNNNWGSKELDKGIRIILGRLKTTGEWKTQTYRFNADMFTAGEARKWMKDHKIKYILFEAATGGKK